MSHKVLRAQITTTKIFENISNFVRDNRYQNNVKTNRLHLAARVYFDNAERASKRGKNIAISYHVLTSSLRYQHTRTVKWNLFVRQLDKLRQYIVTIYDSITNHDVIIDQLDDIIIHDGTE